MLDTNNTSKQCQRAQDLMMKYLDNLISPEEQSYLDDHLVGCEACCFDFSAFKQVVSSLTEAAEIEIVAPEGFEEAVMAQIHKLPATNHSKTDALVYTLLAVLSGLFGLGFLVAINSGPVLEFLNEAGLTSYVAFISSIMPISEEFFRTFLQNLTTLAASVTEVLSGARFVLLGLAALSLSLTVVFRQRIAKRNRE